MPVAKRVPVVLLACASMLSVPGGEREAVEAAPVPGVTDGTVLAGRSGAYPRVIRLAHGPAKGTIVASLVMGTNEGGENKGNIGGIFHGTDDGKTFTRAGSVKDWSAEPYTECCATLYELPVRVGELAEGTLLWAATFGQDDHPDGGAPVWNFRQRVWKSTDQGRTWTFLAEAHRVTTHEQSTWDPEREKGSWEPEVTVDSAGDLVMFFSLESDRAHSQKIVAISSADGLAWSEPRDVVALPAVWERPGMPVVRRVSDGRWLMSYEVCTDRLLAGDRAKDRLCEVYVRWSGDGRNWGNPAEIGVKVTTAEGTYLGSTPTITVSGNTGLINALVVRDKSGARSADTGKIIFGNAANGAGPWFEVAAPVPIITRGSDPRAFNGCPGYSSPLLGSLDGTTVLQITTNLIPPPDDPDGRYQCWSYFGTGLSMPAGTLRHAEGSPAWVTGLVQHYTRAKASGEVRHWWAEAGRVRFQTVMTGTEGVPAHFTFQDREHWFARSPTGELLHR